MSEGRQAFIEGAYNLKAVVEKDRIRMSFEMVNDNRLDLEGVVRLCATGSANIILNSIQAELPIKEPVSS